MKKRRGIFRFSIIILALLLSLGMVRLDKAAAAEITFEVLNPRGELPPQEAKTFSLSPRVTDLSGKRIALIANYKAGAELFLTKIEELLKQRFPTATLLRFKLLQGPVKNFPDIAKQCDTFIHSTGD